MGKKHYPGGLQIYAGARRRAAIMPVSKPAELVMKIVFCRECGGRMEAAARICPHCDAAAPHRSAGRVFVWLLIAFQFVMFALLVIKLRTLPDAFYALRGWEELVAFVGEAGMSIAVGTAIWIIGTTLLAVCALLARRRR